MTRFSYGQRISPHARKSLCRLCTTGRSIRRIPCHPSEFLEGMFYFHGLEPRNGFMKAGRSSRNNERRDECRIDPWTNGQGCLPCTSVQLDSKL